MATIDDEIEAINRQIQSLTELRDRFGALDGDVVTFIKDIMADNGPNIVENAPPPRVTAEILNKWETFKAARV